MRLAEKDIAIGTWITVPHPSVVEMISNMPFEWICVDLEHSPTALLDLQASVSIIQGRNKKAFVRVAQNSHKDIKYPLDAGVDGIIIPMVNSAEEAHAAVSSCLYPPLGTRGVGLARAQGFGLQFERHLNQNHKNLEIYLQIEHVNAVRDIEKILRIERVTGVFLGPYDLSGSMGIPGQFDNQQMKVAIQCVADETKKSGKKLGIHVIPPKAEELLKFVEIGYDFIALSIDTLFLANSVQMVFAKLQETMTATKTR